MLDRADLEGDWVRVDRHWVGVGPIYDLWLPLCDICRLIHFFFLTFINEFEDVYLLCIVTSSVFFGLIRLCCFILK